MFDIVLSTRDSEKIMGNAWLHFSNRSLYRKIRSWFHSTVWKNELKLTNVKTARLFLIYAAMSYPKKMEKRDFTFFYKYLHKEQKFANRKLSKSSRQGYNKI